MDEYQENSIKVRKKASRVFRSFGGKNDGDADAGGSPV